MQVVNIDESATRNQHSIAAVWMIGRPHTVSETACEGCALLSRRINVLGTASGASLANKLKLETMDMLLSAMTVSA